MPSAQTHVVENQPPDFGPRDLWRDDIALREAAAREGAGPFEAQLAAYGDLAGDSLYRLSFDAHRDRPRLRTHDRFGARIDLVEFHPNYHAIMAAGIEHGVAALSWQHPPGTTPPPGAHLARAALSYLHHQVEPGSSCPLTMTHAAIPVLRHAPGLADWAEKAAALQYDPRDIPIADKAGATLGMGMTEKQGGSDVRANSTVATLLGDDAYRLVGHKWFFSAPMSDAFLVLAQAPGGLSCFLMPRRLPGGERNGFRLMRLKDKLGDWSNASSEIEFDDVRAWRVGDEGRGVATILEMVMLTRLDCMLGSAAQMRMALAHALHHAAHRRAFGARLIEQPLMRNVLADLALEAEAALVLAMRVARAVDAAPHDPREAAFARIATAIGKYWICKRTPAFVNEAQECLGGAGYVEESLLPRLYRQAPLNSIWEGSGNIQCLDVLRALAREPLARDVLLEALAPGEGTTASGDGVMAALRAELAGNAPVAPGQARVLVERLALALQGALLVGMGHPLAAAFHASRLAQPHALAFGTLPGTVDPEPLLLRAAGPSAAAR